MRDAPLPADASTQAALQERLMSLSLRPQQGALASTTAAHVSGQSYTFEENDDGISTIKVDFNQEGTRITVHDRSGEHPLNIGYQRWIADTTTLGREPDEMIEHPMAVSGAWTEDDTYAIRLAYTETPFILAYTLRFVDDRVECQRRYNVGFGPVEGLTSPTLVGKRI
jgi:hypothetical protein